MSYITGKQIQMVQIARRQVEKLSEGTFDEASYQTLLRNCGSIADTNGRYSSKQLTQGGLDKCMAIFESMGFKNLNQPADHWQQRNSRRTGLATSRQIYEIHRLAPTQKYPLEALCLRASNNTHNDPSKLTTGQARKLIEGLKAIGSRVERATSRSSF